MCAVSGSLKRPGYTTGRGLGVARGLWSPHTEKRKSVITVLCDPRRIMSDGQEQLPANEPTELERPTASEALQLLIDDADIDEVELERLEIVVRENREVVWRGYVARSRETIGGSVRFDS